MTWVKIITEVSDPSTHEIVIAWMHHAGVDSVVESDDALVAYSQKQDLDSVMSELRARLPQQNFHIEELEDKNWNALWESNFEPIDVGDIHIRADFHAETDKREIIISPKMAFGTGHHETTFMMIDYMSGLDLSGKKVLDYGCGTAILSVMAAMQGAAYIEGVDIQPEAIENAHEHFEINNVNTQHRFAVGDLDQLECTEYDLILANINRGVLTRACSELYDLLNNDSELLVSGILQADKDIILDIYNSQGFRLISENYKGEWSLFVFKK